MSDDHYFTANPASADERRLLSVRLDGHDVEVETAPGVFSPGHVDLGTSVLFRHAPAPAGAILADIGCGWGPIALTMALQAAETPGARVWAVDVNERSLDLTRRNIARVARVAPMSEVTACVPDEVPAGLRFDTIWSNPPIRVGKAALHELLATWLPRLKPDGVAYLVVQKNLGADSLAAWIAAQTHDDGLPWGSVDKLGSAKGFRVLRVKAGGQL